MTESQNTPLETATRTGEERTGDDAARRDRRYRHAITGWFATGMRARAREWHRSREEAPGGQPRQLELSTAGQTQPREV